ncbi:MAG: phage tail protein [Ideonella sp.]|nr:phage tail protein [Ideonella sp.]MCC7455996.1 phage tail protein [Nitrospira sp.]
MRERAADQGGNAPFEGVVPGFVRLYHAVLEHALQCYPREACGLLARAANGALAYHRCRNAAAAAGDAFRIDPRDWAAVEDAHPVVAVVHSHPDGDAHASDADRAMCHASGLPWFIVAVPGTTWSTLWPHRPLPLLGRQFHHGVVDCYSLVRDYYAERLGIALPDFERADGWWDRGEDLYRKHFAEAGFVDLGRPAGRADGATELRLHDALLMQVAARCENHAAVFVGPVHGVDSILHHLYGRLSAHDPWGGYWLRHCTAVMRHRSLLEAAP